MKTTTKSSVFTFPRVATFSAMALILSPVSILFAEPPADKSVSMPTDEPSGARANGGPSHEVSGETKHSTVRADRRFIAKADQGGQEEITLAQLAVQKANSADVRNFAQLMLTDHQRMANDLKQLASPKGIALEFGDMNSTGATTSSTSSSTMASKGTLATYQDSKAPLTSGDHSMGPNMSTGSQIASADHTEIDRELVASHSQDHMYQKLNKKSGADFDHAYMEMTVDDHEEDVALFEKASSNAKDADVRAFAAKYLPVMRTHLQKAQSLAPASN